MALSRASKAVKVEKLTSELASSTSAIIGTFTGLTASKDFDLRKIVRAAGGSYHVVKNKLAAKASQGSKIEAALQGLKGVSSVAYTSGDPVQLAKALSTWVKDNAEFTFKLGIVDGKVITVQEIGALATMPGKEELFSKLLFLIQSPAQRLATVLNATGRDLAVVLGQGVEKEKFAAPAPAAISAPAPADETSAPASQVAASSAEMSESPVETPVSIVESVPTAESSSIDAVATEAPTAEAIAPAAKVPAAQVSADTPVEEAPAAHAELVAEAHAVEVTAESTSQPENGTASQAGEAATKDPVEG